MTNISINLGDALLIDTPPNGQHLYIAIAKTWNNKYLFVIDVFFNPQAIADSERCSINLMLKISHSIN